ncbi:ATP synthase mitochondrial F1 complex assembly factor 1-like isoform X3 [Portunus trituberculatus]|uniref:ATP synthase mitochondrial F1 complex assembly factor 1-like isoform X3 n=1 Tax=Portunus trituberculatus TaxID=210409 RepID=UPI001E1D1465|nr:ATP synthase mitochondrial F1 complex assembly factor 1-like isoform X3 [Portunus trituberculatus]
MLGVARRVCAAGQAAVTIMSKQPVSTSSYAMVKAIEELEKNPYFGKYAGKIAKFQKESPEEFLEKFAKNKEVKQSEPGGHSFTKVAEKGKEVVPKSAYSFAPQKKLESILKTDLLQGKTNQEVAYFVLPLPRDKGYEFIILQFAGHEVHFTSLVNYQAYKENAPECLTLVHYPDLKEERGIVFMHGEYNKDILNAFEAQFLVNQLQLYYGGGDKERTALLEKFHHSPGQFKHMELVEHLEKLDLSVLSNKSDKEQQ